MAKTVAQMVTIVADGLGKSESATALSGALLRDRSLDFLNWGQLRIGRLYNFHELNTYTESATTVADVARYPLVTGTNNLGLVRPKDLQSIRLIDDSNSRILQRRSARWFDTRYPYPANFTTDRPHLYIRWGNDIELFHIPDDAYSLYIRYPQWATDLTLSSTASDYENKDDLLIAMAILEGYLHFEEYTDADTWFARAMKLLSDAVKAEGDMDWEPQAEVMGSRGGYTVGEPWLDPYAGYPLSEYTE